MKTTPPDRVTVVETVYHQPYEGETKAIEARWNRTLKSSEQVYSRRTKVGEEWVRLDTGWVNTPALVVIVNHGGPRRGTIPTPEEKAEDDARVLLIGILVGDAVEPFAEVPPGEDARFKPYNTPSYPLMIKSKIDTVTITINAIQE